eukprot:3071344-Rhodomonas_salina.2
MCGLLHLLIVHLYVKCNTCRQFSFWTRNSAGGAQDAARFALEVARERTVRRYEHEDRNLSPWGPSSLAICCAIQVNVPTSWHWAASHLVPQKSLIPENLERFPYTERALYPGTWVPRSRNRDVVAQQKRNEHIISCRPGISEISVVGPRCTGKVPGTGYT